ncbi:phage portal protein [Sphingopyxis yananensis]|uniref:phage portal protein n=1 Tax=Sphingopyxis yananensis TaxID=2886687 RepID=UPI001D130099|nr:phage portal protein [Sphingopyxis yananensis]MCC2602763.1 phage portal protein [Sphingopyxis yananensis]
MTEAAAATSSGRATGVSAFAIDDAVSVVNRRELLGYVECSWTGRWYEPPIAPKTLAQLLQASAHHGSAIRVKRNLLVKHFIAHPKLSAAEFGKFALDFLVMGNGFLEDVPNAFGRTAHYANSLAVGTRRARDGEYYFIEKFREPHKFSAGSIFHLMEHDVAQELYGKPEYLAALQSLLLNENATLFRRRYYLNGAHAGFIFYLSETAMNDEDVDQIREAMRESRGQGNFKNLFLHVPNGKKDGVQVIHLSEVAAKDEFLNIKNVTRDDVLAAHRVPPQLLGVIPQNNGGFGDVRTAAEIFFQNEIEPLMARMAEVNDWAGDSIIAFAPYQVSSASAPSA